MSENALIVVDGLVKAYGYRPVLKKLSLEVARGDFVGLLGPNGSGKSTLLRIIAGLTKPTGGTVTVGGWTVPKEAQAVRAQIGMVGHQALLYEALTARENLLFFAKLYGLNQVNDLIDARIADVGLKRHADQPVRTYSRGMQQRLSIARALLHDPAVLLFDEPYTGLDQDASSMLDDMLLAAHSEGRTILMSTHQIERAARLARRVIILSRGAVVHDGDTSGLDGLGMAGLYADSTGMATAR
jgi:heme exporter protein A